MLEEIKDLGDYLLTYGPLLGRQAARSLDPLHVPGRDAPAVPRLLRQPFPAQAHVITAAAKALRRQKAVLLVAEQGSGKTLMGAAAAHAHAAGRPYRGLVFAPSHLGNKWARELRQTLPGAEVRQLRTWKDVVALDRAAASRGPEWLVIGRDRAKLGSGWRPAFLPRRHREPFLRCPGCGGRLCDRQRLPVEEAALRRKRSYCKHVLVPETKEVVREDGTVGHVRQLHLAGGCGEALWQSIPRPRRYAPALFVKRKLRGYFDYLVLDEVHEERGQHSAQGHAAGMLAAACGWVIALTGTLVGGLANHLRPLLFRLAPRSLVEEGLGWSDETAFNERYGRLETTVIERGKGRDDAGADKRQSRGRSGRSCSKKVVPGIMPPLFGRHLVGQCIFLSLAEVAAGLPEFREELVPVELGAGLEGEYRRIEGRLAEALRPMLVRGDRRLLGAMLMTLLGWPDYPYGWDTVGYRERGEGGGDGCFIGVVQPQNLDPKAVLPKERALIELCQAERAAGRQVWVYVQFTRAHDVAGRLERVLRDAGFRVGVLRRSVPQEEREAWIAQYGPQLDICVSHAALVQTGLDLFDKGGAYNFSTLVFHEVGYQPYVLRQAARRSWRIGQKLPCKVYYLYYRGTMEERALCLMGRKVREAEAIEGKFDSQGLTALAGDDGGSTEMALARSLAERLDEGDARRAWGKVAAAAPRPFADGLEVCRRMRQNKVTVKALAERLETTQAQVRAARKAVTNCPRLLEALGEAPTRPATARRQRGPDARLAAQRPRAATGRGRRAK